MSAIEKPVSGYLSGSIAVPMTLNTLDIFHEKRDDKVDIASHAGLRIMVECHRPGEHVVEFCFFETSCDVEKKFDFRAHKLGCFRRSNSRPL